MTYTLTNNLSIIRDIDKAYIPNDPNNKDWCIYQDWLSEGNTPNPIPTPPVIIPESVSDRQFFQAAAVLNLITEDDALGMITIGTIPPAIMTAINALPADQKFAAKMKIIGAKLFERNDNFVITLSAIMGKSSADVDALFILADSL